MKIKIATALDCGKERTSNEDALSICPDLTLQEWGQEGTTEYLDLGHLGCMMVVADGMGGAHAGDVASSLAVSAIERACDAETLSRVVRTPSEIHAFISAAIHSADASIQQYVESRPEDEGMGTTIVLCWLVDNAVHIGWCGDSRCYLYRPGQQLRLLTHDHSLVQEMVDRGEITEAEAFTHPDNNIITRSLGDTSCSHLAEVMSYEVQSSDTLLLCTDGLSGYCTDRDIHKVFLYHHEDTDRLCQELLDLALSAGGYDNIGIINVAMIADGQEKPSVTLAEHIKRWLKRK